MRDLVLVGAEHRSAPIELRERLALSPGRVAGVLGDLMASPGVQEALVLSTCGRTELYVVTDAAAEVEPTLRAALPGATRVALGRDVVEHLHRVAAGLESMVLGEVEILGQLRRASDASLAAGARGRVLGRLAHHALAAGRRVRERTGIASGRSSIASVAIGLADRHLGTSARRRALVIGNGDTGTKAARALRGAGIDVVTTSGRVAPASAAELFTAVDLVVSCTAAPHHLFGPELFARAAGRRGDRALVVLDLALPRDVDPRTHEVPGIHLYDLDDVAGEALRTARRRSGAVPAAGAIVAEEVEHFSRWLAALGVEPTIKDLRRHSKDAILDVLRRSGLAAEAGEDALDEVSDAIVTRLLHAPSRRLREAAQSGDPEALAEPVRQIFGLAA